MQIIKQNKKTQEMKHEDEFERIKNETQLGVKAKQRKMKKIQLTLPFVVQTTFNHFTTHHMVLITLFNLTDQHFKRFPLFKIINID